MSKRPDLTIVAVTSTQLYRADFGADREVPPVLRSVRRSENGDIADAVRAALALDPGRPAPRVFVLCEDVAALSLSLPSAQTDGLTPAELVRALAFEAEPFSGLAPATVVAGCRSAPHGQGMNLHWIVECSSPDLGAVRDAVRRSGARLEGLTHPAGLPVPLGGGDASQGWHRVERWTRGRVLVRSEKGHGGRVVVQSLATSQPDAVAAPAGEWGEALCLESSAAIGGLQPWVLSEGDVARRWLHAWGRCLASGPSEAVALAVPPLPGTLVPPQVALGAALLAAAAVLCFGHWRWATSSRDRLGRELNDLRAEAQQLAQVDRRNGELQRAIDATRQQQAERETARHVLDARRQAYAVLLRALADAMPADGMIGRLQDAGDGQLLVTGTGWSAGAVDLLAERLTVALNGTPWTVRPARRGAQGLLADAGPWSFTLRLAMEDAWSQMRPVASVGEDEPW